MLAACGDTNYLPIATPLSPTATHETATTLETPSKESLTPLAPVIEPTATLALIESPSISTPVQETLIQSLEGQTKIPMPDTLYESIVNDPMYLTNMGVSPEQVKIVYMSMTDVNGNPFDVAFDQATGIPQAIRVKNTQTGKLVWETAPLYIFAGKLNLDISMTYRFTLPQRNIPANIDLQARKIAISQGNEIVLDEGLKWWYLYPDESHLKTPRLDHLQAEISDVLLQKPDAKLLGHCLVDGGSIYRSTWLKGKNKDEMTRIIETHVTNMITMNPQIKSWCLALEVGDKDDELAKLFSGYSYVEIAARTARKANHEAYLLIDLVLPLDKVDDPIYQFLKSLKDQELIDGLAIQIDTDPTKPFNRKAMIQTFQKYAGLGISIDVSSLNIKLRNLKGIPELERQQRQADRASEVLSAIIESKVVKSVILWETNYPDKYNWLERNYKMGDTENDWNSPSLDATLFKLSEDGKTIVPGKAFFIFLKTLFEAVIALG